MYEYSRFFSGRIVRDRIVRGQIFRDWLNPLDLELIVKSIRSSWNFLTGLCWICKAPTFGRFELCEICMREIPKPQLCNYKKMGQSFAGMALWPWSDEKNIWCREIIYELKYRRQKSLHHWLVKKWLVTRFKEMGPFLSDEKIVLVPCPGTKGKRINHAKVLAETLYEYLSATFPVKIIDEWDVKTFAQKNQSRKERRMVGLKTKKPLVFSDREKVIFIDDVLTTGATAMAALKALNYPSNFEVWTLFYRLPKLNPRAYSPPERSEMYLPS